MRVTLEEKLFPFVVKPGRYAGGEPGQIVKDSAGRVNYLIAFPDKYEIAQSYVGLQSLYHVVNKDDRFLAERVFAVDTDAEALMRRENIPLFSLESSRPVAEFDAIGFTLSYELVFTNMLTMLDLAGIPLRSEDRGDHHPLVLAGGPAVYNPEPIAPFVDVVFVGDAEEGLPEMLGILHELRDRPRAEKLEALARRVESVYVPQFYDEQRRPRVDFAPDKIRARVERELKPGYYPPQPILPLIETVHSHLAVEIMRGCPQGCRFCQAGPIYRPVRVRKPEDIMRQIDQQISATGYDSISLVSLSSSDYPHIEELATGVLQRWGRQRISIALPALRPGSITARLLDAASTVRKSGLTLAPEAGTERLRLFLRKDFPDQAIFDTVRMAFDRGWKTVKLYFMVGLPTETEEDLDGIVDIVRRVYDIGVKRGGRINLNVTLSPFVPKPHTPFQWDAQLAPEESLRRIQLIKKRNRIRAVNFKYSSVESSVLEGVLGRGDRRMADVIESAWRAGCRFDGWSETFAPDTWLAALQERGLSLEECLAPIPFGTELPWSHIAKGPSEDHLQKERHRTSRQLSEYHPPEDSTQGAAPVDTGAPVQYGRGRKKLSSRSMATAPTKNRVRFRWGRSARYRYMSHLDNLRAIERALRRARLPVAYTQGYNPSMKLSFGPPLPVGVTSEAEYFDVTLESDLVPSMVEQLQAAMPEGMPVYEAAPIMPGKRSLTAALNRTVYEIPLAALGSSNGLDGRLEDLMAADRLEVERRKEDQVKRVNVRAAIYELVSEGKRLRMVLGIGDGGYVRPTEVVRLLTGADDTAVAGIPFHRKDMYRQNPDGRILNAMSL